MLNLRRGAPCRPSLWVCVVVACAAVAAGQRWHAQSGHAAEEVWLCYALAGSVWSWMCVLHGAAQSLRPRLLGRGVVVVLTLAFYLSLCAELAYTYFYS